MIIECIEHILHPIATLKRKTYQEGFRDGYWFVMGLFEEQKRKTIIEGTWVESAQNTPMEGKK